MKKLLIVDDELANRELLKEIASIQGYMCEIAEDGVIAIEKTKTYNPDLILMDIMMPNINGLQACDILKNDENYKHIPIIFVSAKVGDEVMREFKEVKADMYLPKPIDVDLLMDMLQRILGE